MKQKDQPKKSQIESNHRNEKRPFHPTQKPPAQVLP